MWRSIFETVSGRLVSVGTVWTDPIPAGLDFLETVNKPGASDMWDETSRNWVPRPPKVLIDRMDDLEGHPTFLQFKEVFDTLTAQQRAKVRNAIRKMLGEEQFRNVNESLEIGK